MKKGFDERQPETIMNRIRMFTLQLKQQHQMDAIVLVSGLQGTSKKPQTRAFVQWFLGYDYEDICIIAMDQFVYIIADEMTFTALKFLGQQSKSTVVITFLVKCKESTSLTKQFEYAFKHVYKHKQRELITVGLMLGERQSGTCQKGLEKYMLEHENIKSVDASSFICNPESFRSKENYYIQEQCAKLTVIFTKKMIQLVETAIETVENVSHFIIHKRFDKFINDKLERKILGTRLYLENHKYTIARELVQSGGVYDQNVAENDINKLSADVVIITMSVDYRGYVCYCQRTLLFTPDEETCHLYNTIVNIQAYIVSMLNVKIRLSDVYNRSKQLWVEVLGLEFELNFPQNLGYQVGFDNYIEASNGSLIEEDMHFVVRLQVMGLSVDHPSYTDKFIMSLALADTVIVNNSPERVLTKLEKSLEEISYNFKGEGRRLQRDAFVKKEATNVLARQFKLTKEMYEAVELNKRQSNQDLLKLKKQFELDERLACFQSKQDIKFQVRMTDVDAYEFNKPPTELERNQIVIDQDNCAILFPIRGEHYIFHALTIQKLHVVKSTDGGNGGQLKVIFWTNEFSVDSRTYPQLSSKEIFIKELVYKSNSMDKLEQYKESIEQLRISSREIQLLKQKEMSKVEVYQEKLKETKVPTSIILSNVLMRPTVCRSVRSVDGQVQCFENGFKYTNLRTEVIDIPFSNIKHAFYKSSQDDVIAAIHFVFKRHIRSSKKEYQQIQFYREIKGAGEQEAARRQSKYCSLDYDFDITVQNARMKNHNDFTKFLQLAEPYFKKHDIVFETTEKTYQFEGNWGRDRVIFQPTKSCLINIVDHPFFVLTLSDVEVMCCERVVAGTISFDLTVVLKDYEIPVIKLEAIIYYELQKIVEWIDSKNILYFISTGALVWKNMQFSIQKDFPLFVYEGGWTKMMRDQMDHAPIQLNDNDIDVRLFEPDSSQQATSCSELIFEENDENYNKLLYQLIDDSLSIGNIGDSEDFLSEQVQFDKVKKKIKPNEQHTQIIS